MCEVGAWQTFEELEESLTLDDLFILYEATSERQQRMLKAVAAAFGADVSGEKKSQDVVMGPITGEGGEMLFGYQGGS